MSSKPQRSLPDPGQAQTDRTVATRPAGLADLLDLGNQAHLMQLLPMAAYAVRAPNGVIAWFNSRAADLWGRVPAIDDTDERFCGAYKLYHADGTYMAHCDTPVAVALNTGAPVHDEEVIIERPDGSRVAVLVHIDPIRDKDSAIVGVVNFFHDITAQKQTERATGLLAAIVDSSDDAIITKNLDGTITSWNQSAQQIFGYTAEEAVGRNITILIPPDRLDEEAMILKRLKQGERIGHFETIRMCKDGKNVVISVTISPLKDAAGRIIGASKVARDITSRNRAERALRESKEQLRKLADGLESQVRDRTYELEKRNTAILQQSGQLRELSKRLLQTQDEERRRIARDLHDSAGQIISVLGLNLASITQRLGQDSEAGKTIEESRELVHQLSSEIRTLSYLLHPPLLEENGLSGAIRWYIQGLAERSGLKIELTVPPDFGRLPDDMEVAIFRVVQECMTNIHRHSGSKTAAIQLSRDAGNVLLEIQDDGVGIPEEKLAAIRTQSSGVGITGMRERVRNLKGSMDIQSNGSGAKISVTLPVPATAPTDSHTMRQEASRAAG